MERREHRLRQTAIVLVGLALLVLGGLAFGRRVRAAEPEIGVEWAQSEGGALAVAVDPHGPAAIAGLKVGDLLVEVDGRPVRDLGDARAIGWSTGVGGSNRLGVRRGPLELELLVDATWRARPEIYTYLTVVGLAFWSSGLLIALRWPDVRGANLYTLLAFCLFAQLVFSPTGEGDGFDRSIRVIDTAAGILVPAVLVHLAAVLARRALAKRWPLLVAAYGVSGLLGLLAIRLGPVAAHAAERLDRSPASLDLRAGGATLALVAALVVAVVLLGQAYGRSASVLHRSQMRWLLWGLGLGLGPSVMLYALPDALGAPALPTWALFLAVAPMLFVPAAFTAAMARYRVYDLDVLLSRALTEITAIFATFAVYAVARFVLGDLLDGLWADDPAGLTQDQTRALRYVAFAVAAVSFPRLRGLARTGVEKAFYRQRYSYRATLLDWARELNAETDLGSLLSRLTERVSATLGVPRTEVLLRTAGGGFAPPGSDPATPEVRLAPAHFERVEREGLVTVDDGALDRAWVRYLLGMRVKGELRALLLVAERPPPEAPLSSEDRVLLGTLAAHAATAIEAARLVREVRRRAQEVEQLQLRQEKLLEGSAVGLLLLDADGRIQAWNRRLEEIYGLSHDDALGRTLRDVFPPHVVRRIEDAAHEPSAGGEAAARVFRLGVVNRAGQRLAVNLAVSTVGGALAEPAERVVTFDDVTGRVRLEEQLLRQERLAALGLLAAGVAHEINTPLTGISSYAQLLLEQEGGDPERRELLAKIEAQTARAARITGSLLDLARPEGVAAEPLDVDAAVHEVLQLFAPQVRGSGIELRPRLDAAGSRVFGHKGKLQQVLLNLLMNARDAVAGGGGIDVATYRRDGRVVLEVMDDGGGIAEEDLPRIFDPFFTTKGRGKGTGLGLSISYGIVREHAGEIHVDSAPNEFTRFRVELPEIASARAAC